MFGTYFIIVMFVIGAVISLEDKALGIGIIIVALLLATINVLQSIRKLILMKRGKSK